MYHLTLQRKMVKRSSPEKIEAQIAYLVKRGFGAGRGKTWKYTVTKLHKPRQVNDLWLFQVDLTFEKIKGRGSSDTEARQWFDIRTIIESTGSNTRFQGPWKIFGDELIRETMPEIKINPVIVSEPKPESTEKEKEEIPGVRTVMEFDRICTWDDLKIPPELLGDDSDKAIADHEAFCDIYDRNAQIRTILSAVQSAVESRGQRRHHCVLHGHAACGKTSVLLAIEKLFGPGSVLRLDATSTTKAGIEDMFFTQFLKGYPPLVFCEEIEKAQEDALKVWLGALDDRAEIRKVKFRKTFVREVRVLFFCTANNKVLFDKMMGSDGREKGALSSRCVNEIYFPQCDEKVLRLILSRDIRKKGGKFEWIEPSIQLAKELNVRDPRKVLSFLDGGDRLLTGKYQADRLSIYHSEKKSA